MAGVSLLCVGAPSSRVVVAALSQAQVEPCMWDLESSAVLHPTLRGFDGGRCFAVHAPVGDGVALVATGHYDGVLHVVEVGLGQLEPPSLLCKHVLFARSARQELDAIGLNIDGVHDLHESDRGVL
jgi:hypothetical protein